MASPPSTVTIPATLTPSSDSDIKIEVWLPASGWNGKFLAVADLEVRDGRVRDIRYRLLPVFASLLAAVYQFQRRPLPWRQIAPPVLVTLALFVAFRDDYTARLVLAGVEQAEAAPLDRGPRP